MKKIDNNVLFYLRGDSFLDLAPNPVTNIVNNGSVGIFNSLSNQLSDILIDKNIPVEESEKKLFLLIEKVRQLKPLD